MDPIRAADVVGVAVADAAGIAPTQVEPELQPEIEIETNTAVTTVQAAVSPDCSYRLVKAAVDAAQHEICLYIFNLGADHMLELLRKAKARGVTIRLMYESNALANNDVATLEDLGVTLRKAPSTPDRPAFALCHQKFAVIDTSILVLGSANWGKDGIPLVTEPGGFKRGNREWVVRVDNPSLAAWFKDLFEADFTIEEHVGVAELPEAEPVPLAPLMAPLAAVAVPAQIFDVKKVHATHPMRVTPILSPNNYFSQARQLIEEATTSVDIQQQYILGDDGDPEIAGLLSALELRKDELTIRVLVSPRFPENWARTVQSLRDFHLGDRLRGMNLEFYSHLHNKGMIFDRKRVIITSTNLSQQSVAFNREAGVLIESTPVAKYFAGVFDFDWEAGLTPDEIAHQQHAIAGMVDLGDALFEELDPADQV